MATASSRALNIGVMSYPCWHHGYRKQCLHRRIAAIATPRRDISVSSHLEATKGGKMSEIQDSQRTGQDGEGGGQGSGEGGGQGGGEAGGQGHGGQGGGGQGGG